MNSLEIPHYEEIDNCVEYQRWLSETEGEIMEKTYPPITPDEALNRLIELQAHQDEEVEHQETDEILCRLLMRFGAVEIVEAWEKVGRWYA